MHIKIHRGLKQIGGTITEISTDTSRVFIDMGENLPGGDYMLLTEDDVKAMFADNVKPNQAVIYTHAHHDHVGMHHFVPADIPQYMSQATRDIMAIKYRVLATGYSLAGLRAKEAEMNRRIDMLTTYNVWQNKAFKWTPDTITVGDITIRPFRVSHSVYDASMLLIEAGKRRILHTGDFRMHGSAFNDIFGYAKRLSGTIDILITEGTNLDHPGPIIGEQEVGLKMSKMFEAFPYTFVLTSATDVERMSQIYHASTPRCFVTSSMIMNEMVDYFREKTDLLSGRQKHYRLSPSKPSQKLIQKMQKCGFVMPVGVGQMDFVNEFRRQFDPHQTLLVYSAWDGYYRDPEQIAADSRYLSMRLAFNNVVDIHTSAHADRQTIERLITTLAPREATIAIHKNPDASLTSLDLPDKLRGRIAPDNFYPVWLTAR